MADDWGLATLVVALCAIALTLSPASLSLLISIFSNILRLAWPPLAKCERLEWQHISDGPLHNCLSSTQFCDHIGPQDAKQTWDHAVTKFFVFRRGNFVRKPKQLSLGTSYIRTDTKTIKVFLSLLNVRESRTHEESEAPVRVVFKHVEGLMTAYVQIQRSLHAQLSSTRRLNVTKREMELIVQGYPPWYQSQLALPGGRHIPHPIIDESDLSRGGWIVAIGLSPTLPVALDFMERQDNQVVILDRALHRIVQCLGNLQNSFPGIARVSAALTVVAGVIKMKQLGYSESQLIFLFDMYDLHVSMQHPTNLRQNYDRNRTRPVFTDGLTDQQIAMAFKVFNHDERITDDEVSELGPGLGRLLEVVLCGVWKVVGHLYVTGTREFRRPALPPELDRDELIYVRERWESLED